VDASGRAPGDAMNTATGSSTHNGARLWAMLRHKLVVQRSLRVLFRATIRGLHGGELQQSRPTTS
jgi:hypothetical protein